MFELFGISSQALFGQLLIGLINGSFYALLSLGLAVIFGMLNIINFSHGAQYMLGAFTAYFLLQYAGLGYWWAIFLAPIVVGITGIIIERLLIPSVGPPVNPGNVKEKRDERWNYERCAYARGDSARLASGDRIGRQPLGRRGGLSGQRHRRAGEDIGTATSCTRHRLNRNGDHDRLSHSGKAVQSRTGVHPEYR